MVDQVTPQDGDLLDRRIVLPRRSHGETPAEFEYNSGEASLHFRLKQDRSADADGDDRDLADRESAIVQYGVSAIASPWPLRALHREMRAA